MKYITSYVEPRVSTRNLDRKDQVPCAGLSGFPGAESRHDFLCLAPASCDPKSWHCNVRCNGTTVRSPALPLACWRSITAEGGEGQQPRRTCVPGASAPPSEPLRPSQQSCTPCQVCAAKRGEISTPGLVRGPTIRDLINLVHQSKCTLTSSLG